MTQLKFHIIDTQTNLPPDMEQIALTEEWAKGLVYCDMESFAIEEDGTLMLMDECLNTAYCPEGRFQVYLDTTSVASIVPHKDAVYTSIWANGAKVEVLVYLEPLPNEDESDCIHLCITPENEPMRGWLMSVSDACEIIRGLAKAIQVVDETSKLGTKVNPTVNTNQGAT